MTEQILLPNKQDSSYVKIIVNKVKEVGKEHGVEFPYKVASSIRPIISKDLKLAKPEGVFKTEKIIRENGEATLLVYLKELKN